MASANQGVKTAREGLPGSSIGMAGLHELVLNVDEAQTQIRQWGAGLNTFNHQYEDYRTALREGGLTPVRADESNTESGKLHIYLCKSEEEFAAQASSAFEASGAYSGVEAKGSASLLYSSQIEETSSIVFAQVSVSKHKEVLERKNLEPTKEAIILMLRDPEEFVRQYGNYFCMGRVTGGTLSIVMHFKSVDIATKDALDIGLQGSFRGAADAGAKIKAALRAQNEKSTLEITIYHRGGSPPPANAQGGGANLDVEALIKYASEFEGTVADENAPPVSVIFNDYGSLVDSTFRDREIVAEKVLDALTYTLRDYRPPLSKCAYALSHPSDFGLKAAETDEMKKLRVGMEHDRDAIQELLRTTQKFYSLPHPKDLLENKTIQQLPEDYSREVTRLLGENDIAGYDKDVYLFLSTRGVLISAIEHSYGQYYGRLGQGPIKLRFVGIGEKDRPLRDNDRFNIKTTEQVGGFDQRMSKIDPNPFDSKFDDSWAYVGWKKSGDPLEFKIVKCKKDSDDTVIHYGEPVWIITNQLKDSAHLEHGGDYRPDNLCIRNIAGEPGQQWIIRRA